MIKNKEERRFYNYLYLDPTKPMEYKIKGLDIILKYEPFYAGKGTGKRIWQHKYSPSGRFMKSKMMSLKEKGIEPIIIKILKDLTNFESCENEKYLIKAIGRRDKGLGPLCNLRDGGEEGYGQVCSEENKQKLRRRDKAWILFCASCAFFTLSVAGRTAVFLVPGIFAIIAAVFMAFDNPDSTD